RVGAGSHLGVKVQDVGAVGFLKQLVLEEVRDPVGHRGGLGFARPDEDRVHAPVVGGKGDVLLLKPRLFQEDHLEPVVKARLLDLLAQRRIALDRRIQHPTTPPYTLVKLVRYQATLAALSPGKTRTPLTRRVKELPGPARN